MAGWPQWTIGSGVLRFRNQAAIGSSSSVKLVIGIWGKISASRLRLYCLNIFLHTVYPKLQEIVPHLAIAILGLEAGGRRQGAGGTYLIILKKAVNLGSVTINPMYGANIKNIYH